jgi:sec-independent protein translocase protein TatA
MGGLSIGHLLIVLVIALLLFGAGRVSEIGKGLGEGIRNFKKGLREEDEGQPPRVTVKSKVIDAEPEAEAPKLVAAAAVVAKKKKIVQIEVDEDEDEEEIARRLAKKKPVPEDKSAS